MNEMPDEMRAMMPQINETQMAVAYPDAIEIGSLATLQDGGVASTGALTMRFEDGEFTIGIPVSNLRELGEALVEMADHLGG